ncbi:hypothetical protein Tco_0176118 [Tanacetum coccineum]
MSSNNASSAVTYTSVSFDSNGPSSWGISLVNTGELPEMDPNEESQSTRSTMQHQMMTFRSRISLIADDALSTSESPGYIADSDSMEEDTDEDSINYSDEPEDDDDDDDTDDEDEEPTEDKEEKHPTLTDSSVLPIADPVPSAGDTEAFKTDESAPTPRLPQTRVPFSQTRLRKAWKIVRLEPPMSASIEARIVMLSFLHASNKLSNV